MNFKIDSVLEAGGRLGRLTQMFQEKLISLETPMCTLFTKGGSAPHLSLGMLERVKYIPELATMSINSFVEHVDSIKGSDKSLAEFTSMKNKMVFSTLHDASLPLNSGKNEKIGVAVWGKGGKTLLNPATYMSIQETLQADWVMALSDGDTDKESTDKRNGKAVDRTLDFLDEIVSAWKKSQVLKDSSLIGSVVGGFSERHRIQSATETATRPVHGFLLEGFQKGYSAKSLFDEDSFETILSKTVSHLPEDKPRIMETAWSPPHVIKAFKLGIDVFSSAYPHTLTEKGQAMTLQYTLPPVSSTENLEIDNGSTVNSDGPIIDLNDKRYNEDFSPVLAGCQCYTCTTFTRSYIHHLLNTSELLAYVLLTIHNFERYFLFFKILRQTIKDDRLKEMEEILVKQIQPSPKE